MSSELESVPGIGPKTAEYLQEHKVATIKSLLKFGSDKLKHAPGFGEARAMMVIEAASLLIKPKAKSNKKDKTEKKPKKKKDKSGKKTDKNKQTAKKEKNKKKDKKKDKKGKKK